MARKSRNFPASHFLYLFIVQILLLFLLPIEQANSNPLAGDDTALTVVDKSVVIPVLANDTDAGAIDPATVNVGALPNQGTTMVDLVTGAITYSPAGYSWCWTFRMRFRAVSIWRFEILFVFLMTVIRIMISSPLVV